VCDLNVSVVVASPTGHETGEDFVSVYLEGAADAAEMLERRARLLVRSSTAS
jgi:hypothetical protein